MSDDKPEPIVFGDCDLSDVTLVLEDQEFLVHRSKLAESSDVFERMLCGDFKEANQDRVEIKDVPATVFKHLMEIVYHGKIERSGKLFPGTGHCDLDEDEIFCSDSDIRQLLQVADQFNMTKTVVRGVKDGFGQCNLESHMGSMGLGPLRIELSCKNKHCDYCISCYLLLLDRDATITLERKFDRSTMAKVAREIAQLTDKLIPMDNAKLENLANILEHLGDFKKGPMDVDEDVDD